MEKGIKSFRDLEVYKKSYALSLQIHEYSKNFPKEEIYSLTSQIRRCSRSVCANIAEGFVKQRASKAEFKRFRMITIGSATEMLVWIDYCKDLNLLDYSVYEGLKQEYETLSKMLNAFYSNA